MPKYTPLFVLNNKSDTRDTSPEDVKSIVKAVKSDSPSLPLNSMFSPDGACNPNDELVTLPNSVPASLNIISAPSASNIISPLASTVKSPVLVIVSIAGLVKVLFVMFQNLL